MTKVTNQQAVKTKKKQNKLRRLLITMRASTAVSILAWSVAGTILLVMGIASGIVAANLLTACVGLALLSNLFLMLDCLVHSEDEGNGEL